MRSLGCKKNGRSLEIVGLTPTARRNTLQYRTAAVGIIAQRLRIVCSDVPWCYGVYIDPFRRPLIGKSLGQLAHGTFGRGISGNIDAPLERKQCGGENDFSASPRHHVLADLTGKDELRVLVNLNHLIPVVVGVLCGRLTQNCPRIIEQNINPGVVSLYLFDESVKRLSVAEVGLVRVKA